MPYGLPKYLVYRLELAQNCVARLISCGRKHDHVIPLLKELHWLPLEQRIIWWFSLDVIKAQTITLLSFLRFYFHDAGIYYNCSPIFLEIFPQLKRNEIIPCSVSSMNSFGQNPSSLNLKTHLNTQMASNLWWSQTRRSQNSCRLSRVGLLTCAQNLQYQAMGYWQYQGLFWQYSLNFYSFYSGARTVSIDAKKMENHHIKKNLFLKSKLENKVSEGWECSLTAVFFCWNKACQGFPQKSDFPQPNLTN